MKWTSRLVWTLALSVLAQGVAAQGVTDMKPGQGGGPVGGAAGPSGAQGADTALERCDKPMGTMAVAEPQDFTQKALQQFALPSPTGLIRLMMQQSNCFMVVERGVAMQNIMQERRLNESGQLRQGSNIGQGQLVSADFVMTPDVVFKSSDAGGIGGAIGGALFGSLGAAIGGGLKFKQAQTSMLVADTRSGLQVAAASGAAEKADFAIGGILGGAGVGLGLGAYENTPEGKVVAASFLDNWNQVVRAMRGNPALVRSNASTVTPAAPVTAAGAVFQEGDVLFPKIDGIALLAEPADAAKALGKLTKADEMIFLGKEQGGYLSVQHAKGAGWVRKILVRK